MHILGSLCASGETHPQQRNQAQSSRMNDVLQVFTLPACEVIMNNIKQAKAATLGLRNWELLSKWTISENHTSYD